jgi:sulfur-carrier protein
MEKIKVIAFGKLAEIIGSQEMHFEKVATVEEFREVMNSKFPELKKMSYQVALNHEIVHENDVLENNDTIALLPPFSGG